MEERHPLDVKRADGPCADARSQTDSACSEAARLKMVAQEAAVTLQAAMRDLSQASIELEDAEAASDSRRVTDAKVAARATYRREVGAATTVMERQHAVTTWLREIDRINGRSRRGDTMLQRAHAVSADRHQAAGLAQRLADARRIRAEAAAQACIESRQRLAVCEEQTGATAMAGAVDALLAIDGHGLDDGLGDENPATPVPATTVNLLGQAGAEHGPTPEPAVAEPAPEPLVAERLFEGDRAVLRWLAGELSELTGHPPSHFVLLLQEFVEALQMAAADRRFLVFDAEHPLWAQFSQAESRTISQALSDLGFRYHPRDGWYDGRVPTANDFAIAIAYAGFDTRRVRGMPLTSEGFRELAGSVSAAPLELIRELAPELTIRQLVEVLGSRADDFNELWDEWGRVRPLLLTEATVATTL